MESAKPLPSHAEMLRAFMAGDAAYNGIGFIAVRTTAIFCRPTCPARKPLPKNVAFYPSAAAALAAGYRPCKRCRPHAAADDPQWAAALLADLERDPLLRLDERQLRTRGIDPATVRRHFQKRFGMTFQAYCRARRLAGAFGNLRKGSSMDHAATASGFASLSGFRQAYGKHFGTTPAAKTGDCLRLAWFDSPLGPLVAGACDAGVCLLEFCDRRRLDAQSAALHRRIGLPAVPGDHRHLTTLKAELAAYFAGKLRDFASPLASPGTPFQESVWNCLRAIPYGETRSYEQLALAAGAPGACRAAGTANGANRLAILIPCHRVVNKSGALGGYGGGLRRKQFLLELEQRHARLF